jgi:hypothetical protein
MHRLPSALAGLVIAAALSGCGSIRIVTGPAQPGAGSAPPPQPAPETAPRIPQSSPGGADAPSLADLDVMAGEMLAHDRTGTSLSGYLVDDAQRSGGVAAISWSGSESVIFVHPERRRSWSHNTWAFIIGHELSHALLNHQASGPNAEQQADGYGAELAAKAGYDPADYIAFMCQRPDTCSPSHGCFHERMERLENQFNVRACGLDPSDHDGHRPAGGFPGSIPEVRDGPEGCVHRGEPCRHGDPVCTVYAAVPTVIPCEHLVQTAAGLRPRHPEGDEVYVLKEVASPVCLEE